MNDPRVEYFWEQSGSLEVQIAYLERQLTSKHAFPLIGCFDDRPFSYFEIYWAAEDRIGRHYSWQPFDRGLHLWLVNSNGAEPTMCKAGCAG